MITGCILAKNEEKLLLGCLESIKDLCDEIIVIDNESEDKTKDIAQNFGCKVFTNTSNNFDIIRNQFGDYANNPWIFSIDADERLNKGAASIIRETVLNSSEDTWGYTVPKINYMGKGKWSEGNFLTLYRNRTEICYSDSPIHASLSPSIERYGKKISRLDTIVHHIDALYRDTHYKRKKYKELISEQLSNKEKNNDEKYYLYCFMSSEYMYEGNWDAAEKCLLYALQMYPTGRTMAYSYLSQLYYVTGEYSKSLNLSIKMIESVKRNNKYAWFNMARNKCKKGMYDSAREDMHEYINIFPNSPTGYFNLAYIEYLSDLPYDEELRKAADINSMIKNPMIYQERPRSIYQGECIIMDFDEEFIRNILSNISR